MDQSTYVKALTIIIPTYNVSKYINQCLDSLIADKEILDDLEILVINDGSTDDSGLKAQVYADRYPGSVTVINKENGGHGSAVNVGIERANGQYLRILDSDDWVKTDGFSRQVQFIKNQQKGKEVDCIINPYEEVWENGKIVLYDFPALKKYEGSIGLKPLADNGYFPFIWNATFRTQLYRENNIPHVDEGIFYDDIEYSVYVLPFLKTVKYLPDVIYQYRLGTMGQSVNPRNKVKRQWMYEQVLESIDKYRQKEYVGEDAKRLIEIRMAMMVGADCDIYMVWSDQTKAKAELRKLLNKYRDIPIRKYANRKLRLLSATHLVGYRLVRMYYKNKIKREWEN